MSERQQRSVFARAMTQESVTGICELINLDSCSSDSRQLHPLLQTFAAGSAWTAVAQLAGPGAIPVSSQLDFGAPVEIGDTITGIAEAEEPTKEGSFKIHLLCQNQRGEMVLEGWALLSSDQGRS